jgi:phenylpropionate dioxygenase-like ring-hydroxylating dioxygenase large terminal subunit
MADIITTRGADGRVRLLLNRCAHRGNLVCEAERGHATSFRCPYHGWTYKNTGELIGFPFNQGYGGQGTIEAELLDPSADRWGHA